MFDRIFTRYVACFHRIITFGQIKTLQCIQDSVNVKLQWDRTNQDDELVPARQKQHEDEGNNNKNKSQCDENKNKNKNASKSESGNKK